ncbi:hypothetical protein GCM10009641_35830 [Mycobacterium cookii]|uniref:Uncharacterized protein n=1 Tax=Nocardioides furvisabuli TaxID=375542 RepID=A0ABN2X036_9ACTN
MTDDRGVGDQEERLGDEGEERRDGQAQDLPVDGLHVAQGREKGRLGLLRGWHAPDQSGLLVIPNTGHPGSSRCIGLPEQALLVDVPGQLKE